MSIATDLNGVYTNLNDVLNACGAALVDKGQEAPSNLKGIAPKITAIQSGIDTSDATATADDILKGKTAYGATGKLIGTYEAPNAYYKTAMVTNTLNDDISGDVQQNPTFIMFTVLIIPELFTVKICVTVHSVPERDAVNATNVGTFIIWL